MKSLVGYTGFVGSNIYESGEFDYVYNSKNIDEAYGTNPDYLVYAGLRAEKYLANNAPEKDLELIYQAQDNILRINPKKLILISTVDVFKSPYNVDENSKIDTENLHPYGYNRYLLEKWVRERFPNALIVRLPGLYGKNIKKNFIYDYINVIPSMLKTNIFLELIERDPEIKNYYSLQDNGFYKVNVSESQRDLLKEKFMKIGFSAINFTDSRSVYQFYNLNRLWNDIKVALSEELLLWHPATEPVSAEEVYKYLTGKTFVNELAGKPANYNYRTIYSNLFGGKNGYICDKQKVLEDIKKFVENY